jgi:transcriptional regulator with XRE-family HTH domain
VPLPPSDLDQKLAAFLKKRRGEMSFAQFSKLTGMPPSSLFRLEQCEQSLALKRLDRLLKRLKVSIVDVFGDGNR